MLEAFSRCIARLKIPRAAVVVAVSGGSDSVALTYLAKQVFGRVVGVTIDHKLREGSRDEALRTAEIVTGIGAEHHILPLEWPTLPPQGKIQMVGREKRYAMLLPLCKKLGIPVLMTAHHRDDQLALFLLRLSKGSRIDGLGCMREISTWSGYPDIKIVRPLLHCTKEELRTMNRENGLEWVEDPTNASDVFQRNRIVKVLSRHPELHTGLGGLVDTCACARSIVQTKVVDAVKSVTSINSTYGYAEVNRNAYLQLDPPIARRTLLVLLSYILGRESNPPSRTLQRVYKMLTGDPDKATNTTLGNCIVLPAKHHFRIAKQLLPRHMRNMTPIRVGETILWDGRFQMTLKSLDTNDQGGRTPSSHPKPSDNEVFYVRSMLPVDWGLARMGIRKVKRTVLPEEKVRQGLPVIVDKNGKVVLIPHFKVFDRSAGVIWSNVTFRPTNDLDYCIYHGDELVQ